MPSNIEVQLRLSDDLRAISADPEHIEWIIMNVAVNAIEAMDGLGRLTIETKNKFPDEDHQASGDGPERDCRVLFRISDTGHGMEEETLARIYEPFYTTRG